MPGPSFAVQQIDHVELYVPDRYEAAAWYKRVLGLETVEEFTFWAEADGPLMIRSPEGSTMLALFEGEPLGERAVIGFKTVAFRIDGAGFLQFLDRLQEVPVHHEDGRPVTRDEAVDHHKAFSIYFRDPWGHPYEITTYDHEAVRDHLART